MDAPSRFDPNDDTPIRDNREVAEWPELQCLATNNDGSPKHPLYLKSDLRPIALKSPAGPVQPSQGAG